MYVYISLEIYMWREVSCAFFSYEIKIPEYNGPW